MINKFVKIWLNCVDVKCAVMFYWQKQNKERKYYVKLNYKF